MAVHTLTNVRPWGGELSDIAMADGVIAAVRPAGRQAAGTTAAVGTTAAGPTAAGTPPAGETLDGAGALALPGFVNAHAHPDKSWWGMPWVSYGGEATTQGRIEHERAERDRYGIPSVAATTAVLREYLRHGTTATRTHVDVDLGIGLRGIEVVREAVAAVGGAIDVTIVAFPQDGVIRRPGVLQLLDDAAAAGADHIGGLDPCTIDRDPVAQLDGLFDIAERRGVGLDIHLHDGGELGAFQYELIIDRTLRTGLQGKVTVSHGFALGDLVGDRQARLVDRLAEAGISWATVAPVRTNPLPWRRMRERGMGIGLGTDGIRDLWSPFGDGDILRIALGFARLHGLRTDDDLAAAVRLATSDAARFVHRDIHDLVPGARADIVLLDAENVQDALVRVPPRRLVLAGGQVVTDGGEVTV